MKSLILLRGLPGSGKTTLASVLAEKQWPVFSVDSFFTDPETGAYEFRYQDNHLAYKQCMEQAESALNAGIKKVFVDNTFTLDWEIEPYFAMASKYEYQIFVVTVENWHAGQNIHGISDEQVKKMAEKYRVRLM